MFSLEEPLPDMVGMQQDAVPDIVISLSENK